MNILALDTSFGACSAAVLRADGEIYAAYEEMARGHAEALIPMVEGVMRDASLTFCDIDIVAATTGPGSFTGVRIAIAAAQGFAIACGAETAGADSLQVMARRLEADGLWRPEAGPLAILVDARRGEVYCAVYAADGSAARPQVLAAEDAAGLLPQGATVAGTGAASVCAVSGREDLRLLKPNLQPHAAALARLVVEGGAEIGLLRPFYLRAPDAKPQTAPSLRAP